MGMRRSCNFVNTYTKSCKQLVIVYKNMAANNKKRMVFSYDNSIIVSNGQQKPPVTSARQPLKFTVYASDYCFILLSFVKKIPHCAIDCCGLFFIFSDRFRPAAIFVYTNV